MSREGSFKYEDFIRLFENSIDSEVEYRSLILADESFDYLLYSLHETFHYFNFLIKDLKLHKPTNSNLPIIANIFTNTYESIRDFCMKVDMELDEELNLDVLIEESFIFHNNLQPKSREDWFKMIAYKYKDKKSYSNVSVNKLFAIRNKLIHPNSSRHKAIHILTPPGEIIMGMESLSMGRIPVDLDSYFVFSGSLEDSKIHTFYVDRRLFLRSLEEIYFVLKNNNNLKTKVRNYLNKRRSESKQNQELLISLPETDSLIYEASLINNNLKNESLKICIETYEMIIAVLRSHFNPWYETYFDFQEIFDNYCKETLSKYFSIENINYASEKLFSMEINCWLSLFRVDVSTNEVMLAYQKYSFPNFAPLRMYEVFLVFFLLNKNWDSELNLLKIEYDFLKNEKFKAQDNSKDFWKIVKEDFIIYLRNNDLKKP